MGMMDIVNGVGAFMQNRASPQAAMPTSTAPASPSPSMAYNEGPAAFAPLPTPTAPMGGPTGMAATGPMSMPNSGSAYGGTEIQ